MALFCWDCRQCPHREVSLSRVVFKRGSTVRMSVVQYIRTCVYIRSHCIYIHMYVHVSPCRKRSQISWGPTYSTPKKRPTTLLSSMYTHTHIHTHMHMYVCMYVRVHVCTRKLCRTAVIIRGNPQSSLTTVYTYIRTRMPRDTPTGLCVSLCTHVHAYTYMYVCTHKLLRAKGHVSL